MMGTQSTLFSYCLSLLFSLGIFYTTKAQNAIKTKKVLKAYISVNDTILHAQQLSTYDPNGRLLRQQDYSYNINAPGLLVKEERLQYLPEQQILTKIIVTYPKGQEPRQERFETKYLVYAPEEANSKHLWKRHYDAFGELTREDTLTYNTDTLLIERGSYNYMGSTSILFDEYEYQDTLRKRWRLWSKWTTINGRSQVVERRSKRRDYRYWYNRDGKLVRTRGIDYSSKINRWLCYDQQGHLTSDRMVTRRKVTRYPTGPNGKPDKTKKARKYPTRQTTCRRYNQGHLVLLAQTKDGKFLRRQTAVYENDRLLEKAHYRNDSTLTERQTYTYTDQKILARSTHTRFHPDGRERFRVVTTYNKAGDPVEQAQYAGNRKLVQRRWTYDAQGLPLSEILQRNAKRDKGFEATFYEYTYH